LQNFAVCRILTIHSLCLLGKIARTTFSLLRARWASLDGQYPAWGQDWMEKDQTLLKSRGFSYIICWKDLSEEALFFGPR
jgi:hypothetical protein